METDHDKINEFADHAGLTDFLGEFDYTLDEKNRLSIPAKFRRVMQHKQENIFILSREYPWCLTLYPYRTWRAQVAERVKSVKRGGPEGFKLRFLLGRETIDAPMDRQGRIVIPLKFCEHANIKKKVHIVGDGDTIQIWDPEEYENYARSVGETTLMQAFEEHGI